MVVDMAAEYLSDSSNSSSRHHQHPSEGADMNVDNKPVPSIQQGSVLSHISDQHLYECGTCAKKFNTLHGVKIHARSHGYECITCNRKFSSWRLYRTHRRMHTEGLGLECPLCNKRFNSQRGLKLHCSRYHSNRRPFECNICKKTFDTKHSQRMHSRCHYKERHHICLLCNESFSTGLGLRLHTRTHTAFDTSPSPEGKTLTQHSNLAVLEFLCECDFCKKRFPNLKELKRHQHFCKSKQASEVPSKSTDSGQKMRVETAVKQTDHECSFCKRTFTDRRSLSCHVRIHNRVSWKCTICMKLFRDKRSLQCHAKYHRSCMTGSISAGNQVFHGDSQSISEIALGSNSRNESLPYANSHAVESQCTVCKIVFKNAKGLKTHTSRTHKEEAEQTAVTDYSETLNTARVSGDNLVCTVTQGIVMNVRSLRSHQWRLHRDHDSHLFPPDTLQEQVNKLTGNTVQDDAEGIQIQEQYHTCLNCCKSFHSKRGLLIHNIKLHKKFSRNSMANTSLDAVIDADSADIDRHCHICDKSFHDNRGLLIHCTKIHRVSSIECAIASQDDDDGDNGSSFGHYVCKVCNGKYTNVNGFRVHCTRQQHMVPENVVQQAEGNSVDVRECPSCNKKFFSEHGYNNHNLKTHRGSSGKGVISLQDDASGCYECKVCNEKFNILKTFRVHCTRQQHMVPENIQQTEGNSASVYDCLMCDKKFFSEHGYNYHKSTSHKGSTDVSAISSEGCYECKVCNEKYNKVKSFRVHCARQQHMVAENVVQQAEDNRVDAHECLLCDKKFFTEHSYNLHILKTHKGSTDVSAISSEGCYECKVCNEKYKKVKSFRVHCTRQQHMIAENVVQQAEDNRVDIHECPVCNRKFFSEHSYKLHSLKAHKGSADVSVISTEDSVSVCFECKVCNEKYKKVKSFRVHCTRQQHMIPENVVQQAEDNRVDIHECPICNKKFFSEHSYNHHSLKSHKGSADVSAISSEDSASGCYKCKVCNEKYNNLKTFRVHCSRQQHMVPENVVQQAEDNNFDVRECSLCNKKFFSEHGYNYHNMKVHKGNTDVGATSSEDGASGCYECKVCNEKYTKLKGFRVHCTRQQHLVPENIVQQAEDNNVDIYECPLCNRRFFSEHSYNSHRLRGHKGLSSVTEDMADVHSHSQSGSCPEDRWSCTTCGRCFNSPDILKIHYTACHSEVCTVPNQIKGETLQTDNIHSGFTLECCNKLFLSERGLKIHQARYHKGYHLIKNSFRKNLHLYMRDGSDTAFLSAQDPTFPTSAHSERLAEEDKGNNEITPTHQDSEVDFTSAAKDQLYRCSFCSRLFSSEQGRRLHCRRMHEGAKMLTYFDVGNDNSIVNPPDVNVASSTKEAPFECSFCSSVFNNEKGLKIHSAKNHKSELLHVKSVESLNGVMNLAEPSGTLCNVCNRKFDSEEALILHFSKNHADSVINSMIIPAFST